MALLCYETTVVLADGSTRSIEQVLGDGTDPTRHHQLDDGEVISAIELTGPWPHERGAYFRAISRFEAEWPLVEAVARARFDGERIVECALALGGVATVPLRLPAAEQILAGAALDDTTIRTAARACADGASPLPETGYKVDLVVATVIETLERLSRSNG